MLPLICITLNSAQHQIYALAVHFENIAFGHVAYLFQCSVLGHRNCFFFFFYLLAKHLQNFIVDKQNYAFYSFTCTSFCLMIMCKVYKQ